MTPRPVAMVGGARPPTPAPDGTAAKSTIQIPYYENLEE